MTSQRHNVNSFSTHKGKNPIYRREEKLVHYYQETKLNMFADFFSVVLNTR